MHACNEAFFSFLYIYTREDKEKEHILSYCFLVFYQSKNGTGDGMFGTCATSIPCWSEEADGGDLFIGSSMAT